MRYSLRAAAIMASCIMLPAPIAQAQPAAEFYRDKTISLFIGYGAGGGYDQYARLLARHIANHIPGRPAIVARNMPGAGSLNALVHVYNVAPKDGTSIVTFGPEVAFEPLRKSEDFRFDPLQLNWLGSMNRQVSIAVFMARSGIRTILDAKERTVSVGASGAGSQSHLNPQVYNAFLGTKFRVITGYSGTKEITLAMDKGELEGIAGWSWDSLKLERPHWRDSKDVFIAMQVSDRRHPEIPNVPNIYDYISNQDDKLTLDLIFAHQLLGRPFVMAPGVPQDRVAAVREAFDKTMSDTDFRAEADKMRLEIDYVKGEAITEHVKRIFGMPRPLIERAAEAIRLATAESRK
jgi:tripartite-type tricarboxylate transporter receptor subunit TctC